LCEIDMSGRSKGLKSKSRSKLTKHPRNRGMSPITRAIQELPVGTRVSIMLDSGVAKGQPHHRYQGRIGIVSARRGRAYIVEVPDGGSVKKVISRPDHLKVMLG